MNLRMAQHPECWGALDFVDDNFEPIKKVLTINGNGADKPPAGGKVKTYITFTGDPRKCFLGNKEKLKIANALRSLEMDNWRGAIVEVTSGPKKNPEGGTVPVLGMVVLRAKYPDRQSKPSATQKPTETKPEPEKRDAEE